MRDSQRTWWIGGAALLTSWLASSASFAQYSSSQPPPGEPPFGTAQGQSSCTSGTVADISVFTTFYDAVPPGCAAEVQVLLAARKDNQPPALLNLLLNPTNCPSATKDTCDFGGAPETGMDGNALSEIARCAISLGGATLISALAPGKEEVCVRSLSSPVVLPATCLDDDLDPPACVIAHSYGQLVLRKKGE